MAETQPAPKPVEPVAPPTTAVPELPKAQTGNASGHEHASGTRFASGDQLNASGHNNASGHENASGHKHAGGN